MSKYKLDKHIKKYIKSELYNYEKNKKKIEDIEKDIIEESGFNDGQPRGNATSDTTAKKAERLITTKSLLIATKRVNNIERALNKLNEQEKKDVELIFFKGHSQVYAEMHDNISKDMYYNIMDKMIYLTAIEYDEI